MRNDDNLAFDSVKSLFERDGFVSPLDIKDSDDDRFESIVAPYRLGDEWVKCGISSCGTKNQNGFIIRLIDGTETNVGSVCGLKHFKADFQAELRRHSEAQQRRLKLDRVRSVKSSPEMLERLALLSQEYTALKARKLKLRAILDRGQDSRLTRLGKTGSGAIYRYRRLEGRELDIYLEANPAAANSREPPAVEEKIGEIKGAAFFAVTHKDEAVLNLLKPLRAVYATSDEEMSNWKSRHLNAVHKWLGSLSQDMNRLEAIIEQGRVFFERANLENLSLIGADDPLILSV